MGIPLFQCRKCNVDFQPHEGGRCEVCGGWFCRRHLQAKSKPDLPLWAMWQTAGEGLGHPRTGSPSFTGDFREAIVKEYSASNVRYSPSVPMRTLTCIYGNGPGCWLRYFPLSLFFGPCVFTAFVEYPLLVCKLSFYLSKPL